MEFLVYQSRALVAPDSKEAGRVVATALRNNARNGVTGFLHHEPDLFVQYIEGPRDSLGLLWNRIVADTRHQDAVVVGKGLISNRFFADWRMGYSTCDAASFLGFLQEAAGKSTLADASARETIWFLRGVCQRLDLGLVH